MNTSAQSQQDPCLDFLISSYKNLSTAFEPTEQTTYIRYTVTSTMGAAYGSATHTTTAQVYANKDKSYMISSEIEVYQDQQHSVSILPNKKVIYINEFAGSVAKQTITDNMQLVQDTLFKLSRVVACDKLSQPGHKRIELAPNETGVRLFHIRSYTVWIREGVVEKIRIRYSEDYKLSELVMRFEAVEPDHSSGILSKDVLTIVWDEHGNLNDQYRDFKVMDSRQKTGQEHLPE